MPPQPLPKLFLLSPKQALGASPSPLSPWEGAEPMGSSMETGTEAVGEQPAAAGGSGGCTATEPPSPGLQRGKDRARHEPSSPSRAPEPMRTRGPQ